jgi:hypothetical protein
MIEPISKGSNISGEVLSEGPYQDGVPLGIADKKDSIEIKEATTGFSYVKIIVVSLMAIAFFSIAAFFVKLLYKDEAKQAELDAEIAHYRSQLKDVK